MATGDSESQKTVFPGGIATLLSMVDGISMLPAEIWTSPICVSYPGCSYPRAHKEKVG